MTIREKLNEVTYNLKTRALQPPENEVLNHMNNLKRKNTILKRKQTFRSIKDIEAEKMINEIEDRIEKKARRTFSKKQLQIDSQCSIGSPSPMTLVSPISEIKPSANSESEIEEKNEYLNLTDWIFIDFFF